MKLRDTVADLADSLELPEEAVSDAMRVTLIGRRRAERSGLGLQLPAAPGIFVSSSAVPLSVRQNMGLSLNYFFICHFDIFPLFSLSLSFVRRFSLW